MRATTLLSAALLLLISPAFAAPLAAPQDVHGVSANLGASQQPPAPAGPCTNRERRSWIPLWRRQTIVSASDCNFMQAHGGGTNRLGFGQ